MVMVPQAVQYIIFILCMLVCPMEGSTVYVDGINLSGGNINTLIISRDFTGNVFHFETLGPNGNNTSLFDVKKTADDVYQVITPDNSEVSVDLKEFILPDDLKKLTSLSSKENLAMDIDGLGRVEVNKSGSVTYLKVAGKSVMFAIHN